MYPEYLHNLLWIVPGLIGAYFLLLPLVIFFTQRMKEDFEIVPWDPTQIPPPESLARFFREAEEQLLAEGFRSIGAFVLPDCVPNVRTVLKMYIHEAQGDAAMISAIFGAVAGNMSFIQMRQVEFCTRFSSGEVIELNTSNVSSINSFAPSPGHISFPFPHASDLHRLYRLHQSLIKYHALGARKVLRVIEEYQGNTARYLNDVVFVECYKNKEKMGYLRYCPTGRCWRPTFLGAYRMTWKLLWPIKQILLARLRRRARQLEQELLPV